MAVMSGSQPTDYGKNNNNNNELIKHTNVAIK